MAKQNKAFEFGPFRLEVRERRLTRDGHPVTLRGRVFDTLYALVSRHGCLVTKDELMGTIWPDSVVEEGNLNHNICVLRRALGEKATGQKYVETVPRQGYRFVAEVRELDDFEDSDFSNAWQIQADEPRASKLQAESAYALRELKFPDGTSDSTPAPHSHSHTRWYRYPGIISSLTVAALLIAGYFGVEKLSFWGSPSTPRIMLAVLPFENLTGDSGEKYVADGLTHEITAQLGRLNTARLGVIAHTSTEVYQNARKTINEIGQELGVDYVIEGSLRRNENTYRITVMLIRVKDQSHLWAANYNRKADSLTALQVDIAQIVINEIRRRIGVEPVQGSPSAYTHNLGNPQNGPHSRRGHDYKFSGYAGCSRLSVAG